MNVNLKKLAPWNWIKKEQEVQQGASPISPGSAGAVASLPSASRDPLLQLHREVDRLFDEAFAGFGLSLPRLTLPGASASAWQTVLRPSLDIQETDKQYRITLEVPGADEKDIQLTLEDDELWIRGEKRQETEQNDGQYHLVERSYGSFQRVLNLPADADRESIEAKFKNGVLTITMNKREQAAASKGRTIAIER
jgi:HSP20 family protein